MLSLLVPVGVGTARLYRGMHHPTDVLMGFVNGLVCAFLAWNYLRRDISGDDRALGAGEATATLSAGCARRLLLTRCQKPQKPAMQTRESSPS